MNAYSPYALKDLYQAIDLIDRKIAHGKIVETLESRTDLRKLAAKRAALVNSAIVLTNLGVRCDPRFLPRSFIHPVQDRASGRIANPAAAEETKDEKSPGPKHKRS